MVDLHQQKNNML